MPSAFTYPEADPALPPECALLAVPLPLLSFLTGALGQLQDRSYWETEADWQRAYAAIAELEACAMATCLSDLVESNRQLYRLLDGALYGRAYTASADEPPIYSPAIPVVPDTTAELPGLVARSLKVEKLLDNAINGTFYAEYPSNTSIRLEIVRIRELLEEAQTTENQEELLAKLAEIAVLLA